MQKNQLLKNINGDIVRILSVDEGDVLFIPCSLEKKKMPSWTTVSEFSDWNQCSEEELRLLYEINVCDELELDENDKYTARSRYAVIAPVL